MNKKIWKRNAVVATVLLFVCAGIYLNWSYNRQDNTQELEETWDETLLTAQTSDPEEQTLEVSAMDLTVDEAMQTLDAEGTSQESYFSQIRLSRQQSRDSTIGILQETIAYETGADDTQATMASQQLEDVVNLALEEAQVESMVIAKGYADCVCFMSEDTVSVAVSAPEEGLSSSDVASIAEIVLSQSDYSMADIRVIEVN